MPLEVLACTAPFGDPPPELVPRALIIGDTPPRARAAVANQLRGRMAGTT
jgi:hypothetical protein